MKLINIEIRKTLKDESMGKFKKEMEARIGNVNKAINPDFG